MLLRYIIRALKEMRLKVYVTATTGLAANNLNVGSEEIFASTLHWWIGAGLCQDKAGKNYTLYAIGHSYSQKWRPKISLVRMLILGGKRQRS